MANEKKKPISEKGKATRFKTGAKQAEIARKGGIASGEAKRKKKMLKECFETLLESDYKRRDGSIHTGAESLALTVFEKAQRGDLKAFELVRDTSGQKPIEKVMLAEVDTDTISEVESMVLGAEDANSETGC